MGCRPWECWLSLGAGIDDSSQLTRGKEESIGPESSRWQDFVIGIYRYSFLITCLISVREVGASVESAERVVLRFGKE